MIPSPGRTILIIIAFAVSSVPGGMPCQASDEIEVLFREDFFTLEMWEPLKFPRIDSLSEYSIERTSDGTSFVRARSNKSASGMVWKGDFNPYEFPRIRWRWKVDGVYRKGNATARSGDDYPIRLYVTFTYDPDDPAVRRSFKHSLARSMGRELPYRSINYIWANRQHGREIIPNPYTERAMMIAREQGPDRVGQWVAEEANLLDDYREAFGEDPPHRAGLAFMNDSDDTGEASTSYIDFIELYRRVDDPPEPPDEAKRIKMRGKD